MTQHNEDAEKEQEEEAASKLAETYELVEQILLHVDIADVFVKQRVSATWRNVVQRSTSLKKKMWLAKSLIRLRASFIRVLAGAT